MSNETMADAAIRQLAHDGVDPHDLLAAYGKANGAGTPVAGIQRYKDEAGNKLVTLPCTLGIVKCIEGDWSNAKVVAW